LPLGRVSDPNNPSAVGFDLVKTRIDFAFTPDPLAPESRRLLSLPPGDPLLPTDPNTPVDIKSGQPLFFEDELFLRMTMTVTDVDPAKNFSPGLLTSVFTALAFNIAFGECAAQVDRPNLGCDGPAIMDWALAIFPGLLLPGPPAQLGDIDGNGSLDKLEIRSTDPNNPFPFFLTPAQLVVSDTGTGQYSMDPNDPGSAFPGRVNPSFVIDGVGGSILTTQEIVVPAQTDVAVAAPYALTLVGLGAGAAALVRARARRAATTRADSPSGPPPPPGAR
jgi:hypothetical protein